MVGCCPGCSVGARFLEGLLECKKLTICFSYWPILSFNSIAILFFESCKNVRRRSKMPLNVFSLFSCSNFGCCGRLSYCTIKYQITQYQCILTEGMKETTMHANIWKGDRSMNALNEDSATTTVNNIKSQML